MRFLDLLVCLIPALVIIGIPILSEVLRSSSKRKRARSDEELLAQQQLTMGKASDDAASNIYQ